MNNKCNSAIDTPDAREVKGTRKSDDGFQNKNIGRLPMCESPDLF